MKTCSKCGVDKPLTAFQRDRTRKDGHRYLCSDCFNRRTNELYREHGLYVGKRDTYAGTGNWTRENLAWLAGLVEGEGTLIKIGGRPKLAVQMTDQDVIRKAEFIAGMGRTYRCGRQQAHHKDSWKWQVGNHRHAMALMWALWPWLGERRRLRVQELSDAFRGTGD